MFRSVFPISDTCCPRVVSLVISLLTRLISKLQHRRLQTFKTIRIRNKPQTKVGLFISKMSFLGMYIYFCDLTHLSLFCRVRLICLGDRVQFNLFGLLFALTSMICLEIVCTKADCSISWDLSAG